MKDHTQAITFIGTKPTRSMVRYVERQIEKWVERRRATLTSPDQARYCVRIEREPIYPYYHCSVEIAFGADQWSSHESGRTLHEALTRALAFCRPHLDISDARRSPPHPLEPSVA